MTEFDYDIAVIGAGGAGTMAHLRAVLNRDRSVLFKGDANDKRRSRATWVHEVDNIPGMHGIKNPIQASGSQTLKWINSQEHLKDYSTDLNGKVTRIERLEKGFRLHYTEKKQDKTLDAAYVILATGITDVQPLIQGELKPIFPFANRGDILYCLRCDGHQSIGHSLSIIGSGDKTIYMAALMQERYGHESVQILTNGQPFEPSTDELKALAKAYNMQIHHAEISEIIGDPKVALEGFMLADGTRIESSKSIAALGMIVFNALLTDLGGEVDSDQRVLVNNTFESSVPGIFAVGDLVAAGRMQVYTAWDEAVTAAEEINRRLRAVRRAEAIAAVQSQQLAH